MRTLTTAAVGLALLVPFAPAAQASGGVRGIERTGSCSGSADWKLDVKPDDGALEVEWEVDSNKVGQVWRVRIYDNGDQVVATRRTTQAPSGSFDLQRRIANRTGDDRVVARARHLATGQVCRAVITY